MFLLLNQIANQISQSLSGGNKEIVYQVLVLATPVLLAILSFIGILAVKALIKMSGDINEIKVTLGKVTSDHSNLTNRVERLEEKVFP